MYVMYVYMYVCMHICMYVYCGRDQPYLLTGAFVHVRGASSVGMCTRGKKGAHQHQRGPANGTVQNGGISRSGTINGPVSRASPP